MDLVLDIVEVQDDIIFVTGYSMRRIAVQDKLTTVTIYQPAKKRKHAPKKLSTYDVDLTVSNIIVDGEPLDTLAENSTAQIGLIGDFQAVIDLIQEHQWHQRNGRYHLPRNETRLMTLSGE